MGEGNTGPSTHHEYVAPPRQTREQCGKAGIYGECVDILRNDQEIMSIASIVGDVLPIDIDRASEWQETIDKRSAWIVVRLADWDEGGDVDNLMSRVGKAVV